MRKGDLTRDQAINICGIDAVDKLDKLNCDFTNRVQTDGDNAVEFSASIECIDSDGDDCTLIAYYYQDQGKIDGTDDLGSLDWQINGYEIG
jgi:hypothetical protein